MPLTPTNTLPHGQQKGPPSSLIWPGEEAGAGGLSAVRAPRRPALWKYEEAWRGPALLLSPPSSLHQSFSSAPFKNVQFQTQSESFCTCFPWGFLGSAQPGWVRESPARLQSVPGTCRCRPDGSTPSVSAQSFPLSVLFFLTALFCSEH